MYKKPGELPRRVTCLIVDLTSNYASHEDLSPLLHRSSITSAHFYYRTRWHRLGGFQCTRFRPYGIGFPFSITNAPHETLYYFAEEFNFKGESDVGYTGLQPRPNVTIDGRSFAVIHGVFSSFIKGSTTVDPNRSLGADGGPGVSCAVNLIAPY
jgi:hypothetical protein